MPMVNGVYAAPAWQNGASPAINAAELSAMCSVLAGNEAGMANKAPSGFGLGETTPQVVPSGTDLDTITASGLYVLGYNDYVNAPSDVSVNYSTLLVLSRSVAIRRQLIFIHSGNIYMRYKSGTNNAWSAWTRFDPWAFAPSGYGLGLVDTAVVSDCNSAVANGWYRATAITANRPASSNGTFLVMSYGENTKYQYYFAINGLNYSRYADSSGTWGAWTRCDPAAFASSGTTPGTVTALNGTTVAGLVVTQFNRIVTVNGYISKVSATASAVTGIAQISGVANPTTDIRVAAPYAEQAYLPPQGFVYLIIGTSGKISINAPANLSNRTLYFSATYAV